MSTDGKEKDFKNFKSKELILRKKNESEFWGKNVSEIFP
jgi:hypothetical protein